MDRADGEEGGMSMATENLLIELLVEELPPKALRNLGRAFAAALADSLKAQGLAAPDAVVTDYASPRRLGVHIAAVAAQAADKAVSQKLMPVAVADSAATASVGASVDYEPDEEEILADLLPRNVSVQLLRATRENAASEQGSKMTAMDNATRNAGDMINKLTIQYNRTRQAAITTELVEIISGAEAL
jgi:F-type H+-transporting ATPase subunit gamma